jgi:hypothetical protein
MNTLRHRKHRLLLAFAVAAAALASVWLPQVSSAFGAAIDPAKGGKGGGNGHGGGGGGKPPAELTAELQPDVWNTNYENSEGTVSAVIRGDGLGDVNLDSIVLVGTDDAEEPVAALRATRQGKQIRAFFAKDDAIASLDTPTRGELHEVTIQFTVGEDDTEKSLTDNVRIVGEGGGDDDGEEEIDLDLAIQADRWNVNWKNSNGTVSALIRGEGLDDIDLDSIELVGTDPDADPLPALRASRNGNHVRAFFAKDDAFATLDTPKPGEVHEITITLSAGGEDQELTDRIRVVGPNR